MELASNSTLVFNVRRSQPELICPAQPTPIEVKTLSSMDDRKTMRHHVTCILIYSATTSDVNVEGRDPTKVIKRALSEALVYYYPLAGRLKDEGQHGRLVVDCTAEGVVFLEADADVRLDQIEQNSLQPPFPCIDQLVYDNLGHVLGTSFGSPIFTMQITRLLCGGFFIASSSNHVISDALGASHFLSAISELARGASAPSILPVWERELLNARDPPHVTCDTIIKKFQLPDHTLNTPRSLPPIGKDLTYRSFFFGPVELDALRARIPENLQNSCTSFELITASVARSWTIAHQHGPEEKVNVVFAVNARHKFVDPPLPAGYYGNVCPITMIACFAAELRRELFHVADLVKKAKEEVTEEYVRSIIDLGVLLGERSFVSTMSNTIFVSDLSRIGFSIIDFGWGKPVYAGNPNNGRFPQFQSSIVAYRNRKGEDGRLITLCFAMDVMDRFAAALRSLLG